MYIDKDQVSEVASVQFNKKIQLAQKFLKVDRVGGKDAGAHVGVT